MTPESLIQKARQLHGLGQTEEALLCLQQAVSLAPHDPHVLNTRGMVLDALRRHDEALEDFERVLRIAPTFADAINNRGIHYARVGRFEEALACYERSLALAPEQLQTLYNCATARLSLGNWLRGFREFEIRWRLFPHEAARRNRLKPVWLGQWDVSGKTVLLHHEQGYGDTLQFVRYTALVMRLGARVIVAVPAALRGLMATLPGGPQIVTEGEPVPPHDYCCSLMSLPHVFCTTPENAPAEIPYLGAESAATQLWSQRLGARHRARIGLVWSGRRYPPINFPRDMTLESLRPVLGIGADFISLQSDLTDSERTLLAAEPNVTRYGDTFKDFADTAALIANLDLVITVDTAVAHLAGALGKPVWLMNRYASCWRWLQKGVDSPWYPTLRVFRQPSPGHWAAVVRDVCEAAGEFIKPFALVEIPGRVAAERITRLLNSALADHHGGRLPEAIEAYRRILKVDALQPEALHFLGIALSQTGGQEEALAPLSLVLRLQPDNAGAHNHYGNALAGLSRHEEALASYERAIALDDGFAEAHYNRGMSLVALGRFEPALDSYSRALALKRDHIPALNNLGNALSDLGRYGEALGYYERAIELRAGFVSAWVNKAHALRHLGRYEEACAAARGALARESDHAEAHSALGAALLSLGQYDEALSCYRRALDLKPTLAEATWNAALVHLSQGRLREGWLSYESRWKVKSLKLSPRYGTTPPWLGGESLEGKVILLHAEQGYGDSIQFCRYAPLVAARGARVVLGMPGALKRLMTSLEGVAEVVSQLPVPTFDYHCPLVSLPLAFGTDLTTVPASIPYLQADAASRASWSARLGSASLPRVGFAWSGSATHANDANRSIALAELRPLMREALMREEIRCVSVQKDIRASDAATASAMPELSCLGEALTDFADAAALLCELDLLITVDTSVAHLAGALGRPVWILLPHVADWRWLQEREDSPWYPTARLFRQSRAGDWRGVIERVAAELQAFVSQRAGETVREWPRRQVAGAGLTLGGS